MFHARFPECSGDEVEFEAAVEVEGDKEDEEDDEGNGCCSGGGGPRYPRPWWWNETGEGVLDGDDGAAVAAEDVDEDDRAALMEGCSVGIACRDFCSSLGVGSVIF